MYLERKNHISEQGPIPARIANMIRSKGFRWWLLIATCGVAFAAKLPATAHCGAEDPAAEASITAEGLRDSFHSGGWQLGAEVALLLEQLDSDSYAVRRKAAERLEALVDMPEHGALLAAEFDRALRRPEVSFEVHWHLGRWSRRLPEVPPEPPGSASPEKLDEVVNQLDADTYALRLAAVRRLEWLLSAGKLVGPVTSRVKARLRAPELSEASARYLDQVWSDLRPIWSQTDPMEWELPEVSDETIRAWIDDFARAAPAGADRRQCPHARAAERELRDLLMRDEYVPRVAAALSERLDKPADPNTHARLQGLFEETRPAMVAEYWQQRQHLVEQHLLVDVPSQTVGAPRPSHFDRIDDRTARCVCGSSLSPGEYPVGVAIPHPRTPDALFHLINLPTPRRRQWYQRHTTIDPAVRLREISRRTVQWLREQERPLEEDDLRMLAGLDPVEVSRFAGWYLTTISDSALPPWKPQPDPYAPGQFVPLPQPTYLGGRPSRHGALCLLLAADGTLEAMPGLLKAIQQTRILPPSEEAPYRLDWIAALSIAQRMEKGRELVSRDDPKGGVQKTGPSVFRPADVDRQLALAVADDRKLKLVAEHAAEVGATAAAILLARHDRRFAEFSLQPVEDENLTAMGLGGYRFTNPAGRRRVLQWHSETCSDASATRQALRLPRGR